MASGIGLRTTLEGLNIPVLSDLSGVGQNMWVCFQSLQILKVWHKFIISRITLHLVQHMMST